MYRIQTLNKISPLGLDQLPREQYEVASEISKPDGILVRSAELHGIELPPTLKAIARAGAGYNNIPVESCTEKGIIVFNTPGANANSVKELVVAAMLLSSRKIVEGICWTKSLTGRGDEIPKLVEDEKKRFTGPEILGKKFGVIGLGAIGVSVANAAIALGMEVTGYDPYISVESAWGLAREVKRAISLDSLLAESDYITLHVPMDDRTRGMLNADRFAVMKNGVRILNFARGGLVNNADLITAMRAGKVAKYATDFPEEDLVREENVLTVPHLGASTPEAEDNCAIMAARQLRDFLETGNIRNSVNFPECRMDQNGSHRVVIANKNIPNMVGQITTILAEEKINISDMLNRHRGDIAYNIIDTGSPVPAELLEKLHAIPGVIMARDIPRNGR